MSSFLGIPRGLRLNKHASACLPSSQRWICSCGGSRHGRGAQRPTPTPQGGRIGGTAGCAPGLACEGPSGGSCPQTWEWSSSEWRCSSRLARGGVTPRPRALPEGARRSQGTRWSNCVATSLAGPWQIETPPGPQRLRGSERRLKLQMVGCLQGSPGKGAGTLGLRQWFGHRRRRPPSSAGRRRHSNPRWGRQFPRQHGPVAEEPGGAMWPAPVRPRGLQPGQVRLPQGRPPGGPQPKAS